MAQTMSPSQFLTRGEIAQIYELLSAGLENATLPREPSRQVLELQGQQFTEEVVRAFQNRVEAISKMIVRRARVILTRTPHEAIEATGRIKDISDSVVLSMPKVLGDEPEVTFFPAGPYLDDDEYAQAYERRALKPAHPYSQLAVNEVDSTFAKSRPNRTQWKDKDGKWCVSACRDWINGRRVRVRHSDVKCQFNDWWLAGIPK